MKKSVIMLVCVLSAIAYGAENTKDLRLSVGETLFHIIKDDMYKYHASVDLMVVGRNQQRKLEKPNLADSRLAGRIYPVEDKIVRVLAKESDSASDDDTYKPFTTEDTKLWEKAEARTLACKVIRIVEPRIMYGSWEVDQADTYGYFFQRPVVDENLPKGLLCFTEEEKFGEDAILWAGSNLMTCYETALQDGLKILENKNNKTIAFAPLGTDVGFPRDLAVHLSFSTIVKFLTNNPGKYSLVQLFTKKRSEFVLYRELIAEYLASQQ